MQPQASAPLTVVEHRLTVEADKRRTTYITERWKVRLDDPSAAVGGFEAPTSLDGAKSGEAQIFGNLATFPEDAEPGAVFTFERRRTVKGATSAAFRPVPDVPTEAIKVSLTGVGGTPVTLWADPSAAVRFTGTSTQRATVSWEGEDDGERQLVWTTYSDWDEVGKTIGTSVDEKMVHASVLGRDVASTLTGLRPRALAERIYRAIELDPEPGDWASARGPEATLRSGHGNAAERGVALINLLRLAGFEARPALYVPKSAVSSAPAPLPAPSLYTQPAIVIDTKDGPVVLDPANELVVPPTLPIAVQGSLLWSQGDAPRVVGSDGIFDGRIALSGQLVISEDGSAAWSVLMTASGSAQEVLRSRLGGIDDEMKTEALLGLAQVAFPELTRFQMTSNGLTATDRAIRVQLNGYLPTTLGPLGPGLVGNLHPLMAPALTAWLPGRIEVVEEVAVRRPKHVLPLSIQIDSGRHEPDVSLTTSFEKNGDRLILRTNASRPVSDGRIALDRRAEEILHARATEGAKVIYMPWPGPEVTAPLRAGVDGLSPTEAHMLEALAWWREPEERKARKALKRAMATGTTKDIAAAIVRFGDPTNALAWEALLDEATPADRIICVLGMEAQGRADLAWRKAMPLATHPDEAVQLAAKLVMARNQPETQPTPEADREGHTAWRDQGELLSEAMALSEKVGDEAAAGEVLETLAELALEAGELEASQAHMTKRLEMGETPDLLAMQAEIRAQAGASPGEVRQLLASAGALHQQGTLHAAHALSFTGDHIGALAWAQISARLAPDDPTRWDTVADAAIASANLPSALQAARRASDAAPNDRDRARKVRQLATLIGDRTVAQEAAKRAGEKASDIPWPADFGGLTGMAGPDELRAVLVHHDDATTASAQLLAIRAQLSLEAGDIDTAGRDGALLHSRFDDARGVAFSFAAAAGRTYGSGPMAKLTQAAAESTDARRARLEYGLITGSHDPLLDAKKLPNDAAAVSLVEFSKSRTVDGWEGGTAPALSAPGLATASLLGAAAGVTAKTDRSRGYAVVRHVGPDLLPPPLSMLYTPRDRAMLVRDDGVSVYRHDGGLIPLYSASTSVEGVTTLGLGFTPQAAQRALDVVP